MKLNSFPFKQARNYTKGRIKPVQLIVLHSMESPERVNTAENVAGYFAGSNAPMASAHYCVDADSIVQSVRLEDTAYHCKNANANGVGIEHAGYAKQTRNEWLDPYGKAMLELSAQLTAALCSRYNIPPRRAQFASKDNPRVVSPGICGHADVPNHGSHWDPGPGFPMDYYLERVKFYLDSSLERVAATTPDIQQPEVLSSPLPVEIVPPLPEESNEAPATQQVAEGGAATQVVVQPNAPTLPPVVKSALEGVAEIASTGMGQVGKKITWSAILSGLASAVWAGIQQNWVAILAGFLFAIFLIGIGIAVFLFAYHWAQKKKITEAQIRSDPTRFNVSFEK